MKLTNLKKTILSLPSLERDELLKDITNSLQDTGLSNQASRRYILDNKMGSCPRCLHDKYV